MRSIEHHVKCDGCDDRAVVADTASTPEGWQSFYVERRGKEEYAGHPRYYDVEVILCDDCRGGAIGELVRSLAR